MRLRSANVKLDKVHSKRGVALFAIALSLSICTYGQTKYRVLHSFGSGTDGGGPSGSVNVDKNWECVRLDQRRWTRWLRYCL
jgi:hypothetical protein